MRRLVDEQLGRMEQAGRWLPYWLASLGLIAAGLLVLGTVSGSPAGPVACAVATAAFCCWVPWMRRRTLARYRSMRTALHGEV
ncbi:hypothetical protein ABZ371_14480 [Streptomyces sp. NPDC005899]|uniref:hypothetical protein n=1 Tax=Streptomyces sp. NPDC005899 TaxID=3155716 RepID=UPI0033CF498D